MLEALDTRVCQRLLREGSIILLGLMLLLISTSAPAEESSSDDASVPQFSRRQYTVGPGDQLEIKLFYNSELNTLVTVDPGGNIDLQLIGQIHAADLSVPELQQVIESRYGTQLTKPQASVVVKVFGREHVFVHGEVGRPGVVELTDSMTVLQAIASAGGLKDTAREKEILIIRFPRSSGRPTVIKADVHSILQGHEPISDLVLAPMDEIFVPRSHIADVNLWIDQYIRKNIPVSLYLPLGSF
jgi:polysaccharide export outer membrane protein